MMQIIEEPTVCKRCTQRRCNGCKKKEERSGIEWCGRIGTTTVNGMQPGYVYEPYVPMTNYKNYLFQAKEDITMQQLIRALMLKITISQQEYNRLSQDVKRHFKQQVYQNNYVITRY